MAHLEHVNITTSNPQRLVDLCQRLFGWRVRWSGQSALGGDTWHVGEPGDGKGYIAVYGRPGRDEAAPAGFAKGQPLNHIGVVVPDLDRVEALVVKAGLTPFSHGDYAPGHRFYFFDWDGIEWEIVSYANKIPAWARDYIVK